jgi:hypothetical protein
MQIKILVSLAGDGFSWNPGETIEAEDAECVRLIEAGYAEPVRAPAIEKATASKREKAVSVQKDDE